MVAWLIDWACFLGLLAVVAAVFVPLALADIVVVRSEWAANVVSFVASVLPVVLLAAWFESRPRAATPGKRVMGLTVRGDDGRVPGFGRALLRNAVKIGIPWTLGHAVAIGFVHHGNANAVPTYLWVLTVATYAVIFVWVLFVLLPGHRALHDRIAGTGVALTEG